MQECAENGMTVVHVFMLSSMGYPTLPVGNELVRGVGAGDGVQAGPGLLQGLQLGLDSLHCHLMPTEQLNE